MKKSMFLLFFCAFTNVLYSQIVLYPNFNKKDVQYLDLTKSDVSSSETKLFFRYTSPSTYLNGGWVSINKNTFIQDNLTGKKYYLQRAENIPISPETYNFKSVGEKLEFILYFPPIPDTVSTIDIIESENDEAFNFYGVNIKYIFSNSSQSQDNEFSKISKFNEIIHIDASPKPSFESLLASVKTAVLVTENRYTQNGYLNYLREMGFNPILFNKLEEAVDRYGFDKSALFVTPLQSQDELYSFVFIHLPTGYQWTFSSTFTSNDLQKYNYNLTSAAYEIMRRAYGSKKPPYNRYNTLNLAKWKTGWKKSLLIDDFQKNGIKDIEGVYESTNNSEAKYCVAVKKIKDLYRLIYISGANNQEDWDEGELKATLIPTATPYLYKAKWIMANKKENSDFYISFEQGFMSVLDNNKRKSMYVKMFPSASDDINIDGENVAKASGTGFAVSGKGMVVTNYHVIENANKIRISGINGDFSKKYEAVVVLYDRNNDLAVLKIKDDKFISLGKIPYVIKADVSNVGTDIYVLGYPLRSTMGDDVKLTTGVISSKSGYQGDVTAYQISASVQPGNSGGPLFDKQGRIIGIINAKHARAENASYAIKSTYLMDLINSLDVSPTLNNTNTLTGKTLVNQVKDASRYVYIIEVE
nr:serine protease [uncultured Bacteroides sp.]